MSAPPIPPYRLPRHVSVPWLPVTSIIIGVLLVFLALNFYYAYPAQIGPRQPIPISHRIHVTEKRLSCVMCHYGAFDSPHADIPPLETCMLCHSRIIIHHPWIEKLREHYYQKKPVEWVRISYVPDFVFFKHQAHLIRGVDCGHCHGDVAHMDRIVLPQKLEMGFCISCHKDYKVSHDCYVCHR